MARELKEIICEELRSRFKQLDGCVLIDHRGLDSEHTDDLRRAVRETGLRMNVVPNRLARRVFLELQQAGVLDEFLRAGSGWLGIGLHHGPHLQEVAQKGTVATNYWRVRPEGPQAP